MVEGVTKGGIYSAGHDTADDLAGHLGLEQPATATTPILLLLTPSPPTPDAAGMGAPSLPRLVPLFVSLLGSDQDSDVQRTMLGVLRRLAGATPAAPTALAPYFPDLVPSLLAVVQVSVGRDALERMTEFHGAGLCCLSTGPWDGSIAAATGALWQACSPSSTHGLAL